MLEIYTDGACSGNPGPGGWAAILLWKGQKKCIKGYEANTTNNRMELRAAVEGLKSVKRNVKIILYTDSQYLKKGMTEWITLWLQTNWNKGKVKNQDLWKQLHELNQKYSIEWKWIKAHNGHILNEEVDSLARLAIQEELNGKNISTHNNAQA